MKRKIKVKAEPEKKNIRCAIYTRKSTEDGLEQEFNSLDAQREAGEAYIKSQESEGWICLADRYDDGGFSGGNIERPALHRLIEDIEADRIDCLVVYKVDRLSRSLMDFSRLMEMLERKEVAFVSVTQQFNTSHSMGRLTLNILLSFAQFEREIISERTRDKIAAARRKGKWVGGRPILGYDVDLRGGRLLVNEEEASRVREIFRVYTEKQSLHATMVDLNGRGWEVKKWVTRKGHTAGGGPFSKTHLSYLLANVAYLGKTKYKDEVHEGEHSAIVPEALWNGVQELLKRNANNGGKQVRNKQGALLRGLIYCEPCQSVMIHSYSLKRKTRRYRYYVCSHAQKNGWDTCPSKSISAGEIEGFVMERIRDIGRDEELVAKVLEGIRQQTDEESSSLHGDRESLQKDLRRQRQELKTATNAFSTDPPEIQSHRLDGIQKRIQATERRLTELCEAITQLESSSLDAKETRKVLAEFTPAWEAMPLNDKTRLLNLLIERIDYNGEDGTVSIAFRSSGIKTLSQELAQ